MGNRRRNLARIFGGIVWLASMCGLADEGESKKPGSASAKEQASQDRLVRLSPDDEVWLDMKQKRVVLGGTICLTKGTLEMFACPQQTKEHESVVSVHAKAYVVHTALLAVGANAGTPVQYDPVYMPATGSTIRVDVIWKDADGKLRQTKAQDMIRHIRTRKPMEHDWVFAGSQFWTDQTTGTKYYQAEGGELICVSNFSNALMDLPVPSSQSTSDLLFEAFTENIPPLGTKVRLVLTPVPAADEPPAKDASHEQQQQKAK